MIILIDLLKGALLCLLFTVILRASEMYIDLQKGQQKSINKTTQIKMKIFIVSVSVMAMVGAVYHYECRAN